MIEFDIKYFTLKTPVNILGNSVDGELIDIVIPESKEISDYVTQINIQLRYLEKINTESLMECERKNNFYNGAYTRPHALSCFAQERKNDKEVILFDVFSYFEIYRIRIDMKSDITENYIFRGMHLDEAEDLMIYIHDFLSMIAIEKNEIVNIYYKEKTGLNVYEGESSWPGFHINKYMESALENNSKLASAHFRKIDWLEIWDFFD